MFSEDADDPFNSFYNTARCVENYEQVVPPHRPAFNSDLDYVLYTRLHRRNDCQTIRI